MTDLRKAAEMALEALEWNSAHRDDDNAKRHDAIEALHTALAKPEQEPVDWNSLIEDIEAIDCRYRGDPSHDHCPDVIRDRAAKIVRRHSEYYTAPPSKQEPVEYDAPALYKAKAEREQAEKQEPVAWDIESYGDPSCMPDAIHTVPLFTAPVSKREWVSLTDERIAEIVREAAKGSAINRDGSTSHRVARAIEAASKELNT